MIEPTSGSTYYREPGQAQRQRLTAETSVPVNTIIDATNGRMGIQSANGTADFFGGAFVIREPKKQPVTQLWLAGADPRKCKARTTKVVRQVWGDGNGPLPDAGPVRLRNRPGHEVARRRTAATARSRRCEAASSRCATSATAAR